MFCSRSSPISSNIFNSSIQHISKKDSEWLHAFQKRFTGRLIPSLFQLHHGVKSCCGTAAACYWGATNSRHWHGSLFSWIITCWGAEFSCPGGLSGIVVSSLLHQHFSIRVVFSTWIYCIALNAVVKELLDENFKIHVVQFQIKTASLCVPCQDISNTCLSGRRGGYCYWFPGLILLEG